METVRSKTYITFKLHDETFGVNVLQVINIIDRTSITKIPKTPSYILGVINLRGTVLPVIDLRIKLGIPVIEKPYHNYCILVFEIMLDGKLSKVGALVDSVQEVVEIGDIDSHLPSTVRYKLNMAFIEGIAKIKDFLIILLNMDIILSQDEIVELSQKLDSNLLIK